MQGHADLHVVHLAQAGRARSRYFVKVAAEPTAGPPHVTSAVWVIDEAKPLIPGFMPANEGPPSNRPVTGRSIEGAPLPAVPVPTISLPALPRTIRGVLASGVRLRADARRSHARWRRARCRSTAGSSPARATSSPPVGHARSSSGRRALRARA
jgi:hypothetical protein